MVPWSRCQPKPRLRRTLAREGRRRSVWRLAAAAGGPARAWAQAGRAYRAPSKNIRLERIPGLPRSAQDLEQLSPAHGQRLELRPPCNLARSANAGRRADLELPTQTLDRVATELRESSRNSSPWSARVFGNVARRQA